MIKTFPGSRRRGRKLLLRELSDALQMYGAREYQVKPFRDFLEIDDWQSLVVLSTDEMELLREGLEHVSCLRADLLKDDLAKLIARFDNDYTPPPCLEAR